MCNYKKLIDGVPKRRVLPKPISVCGHFVYSFRCPVLWERNYNRKLSIAFRYIHMCVRVCNADSQESRGCKRAVNTHTHTQVVPRNV